MQRVNQQNEPSQTTKGRNRKNIKAEPRRSEPVQEDFRRECSGATESGGVPSEFLRHAGNSENDLKTFYELLLRLRSP